MPHSPENSPSQPSNPSSGPRSYQPSSETVAKHETAQLRSDILIAFENQFPELPDEDPRADAFIDQLSRLNDKAQLTALKEEFAEYTDANPEDWTLVLTQEIEGAPVVPFLKSIEDQRQEKRNAMMPRAEEYCDLYFSNAETSVQSRAKENMVQLLADGFVFTNLIEHISSPVRAMQFVKAKNSGPPDVRFLYPNGEIFNGPPGGGRRQSNEPTPSSSTSAPVAPATAPAASVAPETVTPPSRPAAQASTLPATPASDALADNGTTPGDFSEEEATANDGIVDDYQPEPGEPNVMTIDGNGDDISHSMSPEMEAQLADFKSGNLSEDDLPEGSAPMQKISTPEVDPEDFGDDPEDDTKDNPKAPQE